MQRRASSRRSFLSLSRLLHHTCWSSLRLFPRIVTPPNPAGATLATLPFAVPARSYAPDLPGSYELSHQQEPLPGCLLTAAGAQHPAAPQTCDIDCVCAPSAAGGAPLPADGTWRGAKRGSPAGPHQLATAGQPAGDPLERGAEETARHAGKCLIAPQFPLPPCPALQTLPQARIRGARCAQVNSAAAVPGWKEEEGGRSALGVRADFALCLAGCRRSTTRSMARFSG